MSAAEDYLKKVKTCSYMEVFGEHKLMAAFEAGQEEIRLTESKRNSELEQENTNLRIENADLKKSVLILKEACEHVV